MVLSQLNMLLSQKHLMGVLSICQVCQVSNINAQCSKLYSLLYHRIAYFPVQSGSYAPLVFISGLYGFLYSEMYSNVLTELVTHGYIVLGLDLAYPGTGYKSSIQNNEPNEAQRIDKAITWVCIRNNKFNTSFTKFLMVHYLILYFVVWSGQHCCIFNHLLL